jgi:phosphoribosylformimino-5-aminoimidazole carboxamide ribotide isomerase
VRIIPVLDILGGHVVRGVGGRRDEYRPVVSSVTASTHPFTVANDLLGVTAAREVYVADLDAIRGGDRPSPAVREFVNLFPAPVWLDFGVRHAADARLVPATVRPVVGTETADGPGVAAAFRDHAAGFAVSIDLMNGKLLGRGSTWGDTANDVAAAAVGAGARTLIVLDLAAVGGNDGPRTLAVCRRIRDRFPDVGLLTGGGVRNREDVEGLAAVGVDGVLVASAFHDGRLP